MMGGRGRRGRRWKSTPSHFTGREKGVGWCWGERVVHSRV